MPRALPVKVRARASAKAIGRRERPDHLGWWPLSISFAAVLTAGILYLAIGDNTGAAFVITAAAAIIAIMLRASGEASRS
jgi:hypothetical protein